MGGARPWLDALPTADDELMSNLHPTEPPTVLDDNGLQILDRRECLLLLSDANFGRIGVTFGAIPVVLPLNYRLVDDVIVFRTSPGTKLDAAVEKTVVAFEVDDIEPVTHAGWSVLVTGIARQVTDPEDIARYTVAHVPRWAKNDDEHFVTVSTAMISGRRLHPGAHAPTSRSAPTS